MTFSMGSGTLPEIISLVGNENEVACAGEFVGWAKAGGYRQSQHGYEEREEDAWTFVLVKHASAFSGEVMDFIDHSGQFANRFIAIAQNAAHRCHRRGIALPGFIFGAEHVGEKLRQNVGEGFGFDFRVIFRGQLIIKLQF